jgi:hypothetical protein
MALASAVVPPELRASGLALLVTMTSVGRLLGSVLFGALWTGASLRAAVVVFAVGLLIAMFVTAVALARSEGSPAHA